MQLARFRDKGLRQLYEDGNARGVPSSMADKLRKLLLAVETAESLQQLGRLWSLTVSGNWRLIFRYDEETNAAIDIDLIDDH